MLLLHLLACVVSVASLVSWCHWLYATRFTVDRFDYNLCTAEQHCPPRVNRDEAYLLRLSLPRPIGAHSRRIMTSVLSTLNASFRGYAGYAYSRQLVIIVDANRHNHLYNGNTDKLKQHAVNVANYVLQREFDRFNLPFQLKRNLFFRVRLSVWPDTITAAIATNYVRQCARENYVNSLVPKRLRQRPFAQRVSWLKKHLPDF